MTISNGMLQIGAGIYVDGDSHASGPSQSTVIVWHWDGSALRVVNGI